MTRGTAIYDLVNGTERGIPGLREIRFPDGQPHFEVDRTNRPLASYTNQPLASYADANRTVIVTRLTSADDIVRLLCLCDCLYRAGVTDAELRVLYLFGARMDRSINGGAVTVSVVADMLNASRVRFTRTLVFDPHSDVATAVLPNAVAVPNTALVGAHLYDHGLMGTDNRVTLVAPDAGATKRVAALSDAWRVPYTQGHKHRDTDTGRLSGFRIDPMPDATRTAVIVDDICDGGGTFVGLASAIHDIDRTIAVHLVVSHGIFSRGYDLDGITAITTTNSFTDHADAPNRVCVRNMGPWLCDAP